MQRLQKHKNWLFSMVCLVMMMPAARAGGGGRQVRAVAVLDGSQHQIAVDSSRSVQDSTFYNPANLGNIDTSYSVQNQVTVMINEASTLYLRTAFSVTIRLRIFTTSSAGTVDSVDRSFTVNYDSAHTYSSRSTYVFKGAHQVTIKVLSDSSNVTTWDPKSVLLVENMLIASPVFTFNCSTTVSAITISPSDSAYADELPISWSAVQGADQYDIEWTYIDTSALVDVNSAGVYKYGNPLNPDLVFLNNSTRVTVTGTSYKIPLMYDDTGTLFIRVRPVQLKNAGAVISAIWSSDASPSVMGRYSFTGHQPMMNWQSNISYAEEGKRKVVVQYYDGSFRSRQTVTKDNTSNTTIVSETYYDYQGRPQIQVLPSPTLSTIIKYTAGFNVSINGAEYSQANYDTLPVGASFCSLHADSMSSLGGASAYYSPRNPVGNIGLNQFIPDAHDYPFKETEYTPDNTGRISRQGEEGPFHQLGTGHETKYYYGSPDQHELDALFGTEVGDKSHYFKNMVRDANGQYSVSYVDMNGRTIATALAGNAPAGMGALSSNTPTYITETLSDPNKAFFDNGTIMSQKALVVATPDTFRFNYSFAPPSFTGANCQMNNVCYSCKYDLEITVSSDCNNGLLGGQPFDTVLHNFSLGSIAASCPAGSDPFNVSFNLYLPEGSYAVTKKLTADQGAYQYYRDSVYIPGNTCTSLSQFISQQNAIIASTTTQCVPDCKTCKDSLGTWSQFLQKYITGAGLNYPADTAAYLSQATTAYNNALSACAALCGDSLSDGDDVVNAMLQDMSPPYGQYADSTLAGNSDKYSIFYIPAGDTLGYTPVYQLPAIHYLDDNGAPDSVYDPASGLKVTPNQLDMATFVQNFKSSWANALLPYHPEYCRLQALQAQKPSSVWDRNMQSVDDFSTAYAMGYLNPTGNTSSQPFSNFPANSANIDPFSQESSAIKNALEAQLKVAQPAQGQNPNLSMWALACGMVKCDSTDSKCLASFEDTVSKDFNTAIMCDGDLDLAWKYFRQMYVNAKQEVMYQQIISKVTCTPMDQAYSSEPDAKTLAGGKIPHTPEFTDAAFTIGKSSLSSFLSVNSPTSASNAVAAQNANVSSYYDQNVSAESGIWIQQLSSCSLYSPAALTGTIIPNLSTLCRAACDESHPYGASTLPNGDSILINGVYYKSFQDIINHYNQSAGISDALNCNAEVITTPAPYNMQPVYSTLPVYNRPSDCQCALINDQYNLYLLAGKHDSSFSSFLRRTQQISMTDADLTQLRLLCGQPKSSPAGCTYLAKPIYLPAAFQCNVSGSCASCTAVSAVYTSYLQQYPADTPAFATDADTLQDKKNTLFQNYMNNRLGFNKQAWEYLQFLDTCAAHTADISNTNQCLNRTVANLYISGGTDNMRDIQATADNGYILAGSSNANGPGGQDAYLIKTDHSGNIQWANTYGGYADDNFARVRQVSGNNYIAIGTTKSATYIQGEMLIQKTDPSGNSLWSQAIGFGTGNGEVGYDIIQTSDGGYAALGNYNQHNGNGDLLVARLDSLGNILWVHRFGTSADDNSSCTIELPDSTQFAGNPSYGIIEHNDTLVVTGTSYDRNLGSGYFGSVYQLAENTGNVLSSWQYKDSTQSKWSSWFGDIYHISTGYLLSVTNTWGYGSDSAQAAVMRLSTNGTVLDYRRFNRPEASDKITHTSVFPTSDGGYLVAQTADYAPHIYWQRLSATDSLLWTNETALPDSQSIGRLIQNNDSSFTAVINEQGHAMLLNMLATPAQSCFDYPVTLGLTAPGLTKITAVAQGDQFLPVSGSSPAFATTTITPQDSSIICTGGGACYNVYTGPTLCGKSVPLASPEATNPATNCSDSTFFAVSKATELFKAYTDSLTGNFEQQYNNVCLQAFRNETFTVTHTDREYNYTLYYFDQAGNLIKTVPPVGVMKNADTSWLNQVDTARAHGQILVPAHTLTTNYRYNAMNQLVAQHTPDAGTSAFWYDRLGRPVLSQNARQRPNNQYSYTLYDTIARIIQIGQLSSSTGITDTISRNDSALQVWVSNAMPTANQITVTSFDSASYNIQAELGQRNMRNRISWTALFNSAADLANGNPNATSTTYYTYDILGNADTLVQDFGNGNQYGDVANSMNVNGNRFKKISYDFDLVSGKVNQVSYQQGNTDAFYHVYLYDAENRITNVQSSIDSIHWDNDAFYSYYPHGPLARTVLGQQQVQGINYAYTLQGWLKAINPTPDTVGSNTLRSDSSSNIVANSAYNVLLNYFDDDYNPISTAAAPDSNVNTTLAGDYRPLYNGNISSMGVRIRTLGNPLLYNYQYDQLNRLINMDAWSRTGTAWSTVTKTPDFQERVAYDPNGNILQYRRNGNSSISLGMDSLNYFYTAGTNRLDHITDSVTSACSGCNDITGQSAGNFQYDSTGELTADAQSGITQITWTIYGRIASISKPAHDTTILFTYDALGNRISKSVVHAGDTLTTWYIVDAQGHILSVYTYGDPALNGKDLTQSELDIYGGSRIGMWRVSADVQKYTPPSDSLVFIRGNKLFELTNHLGNVLSTISDKRYGVSMDDSTVAYFNPDVINATDYYPFGMIEPGRQYAQSQLGNYRFGFNGKEQDNEVKGIGNQINYGMRIYDPRIGRFLSTDPLFKEYAQLTPYQYSENMPVWAIDLDGLEAMKANSVYHIIKDVNGNIINTPTKVRASGDVSGLTGVKKLDDNFVEVTPGFTDKGGTYEYYNTFEWQQVDGDNFYLKQTNVAVGQNVPGTPPQTTTQNAPNPGNGIPQNNPVINPINNQRIQRQTIRQNINFVPGQPIFLTTRDQNLVTAVARNAPPNTTTPGTPVTTTTGTTTTTTTTTTTVRTVITIDLRTDIPNSKFSRNLLNARFNLVRAQLIRSGVPPRNIRRGRTQYNQPDASMGGNPNQTIFRVNTTTTTTQTGQATTTPATTTPTTNPD